MGMGRLASPRGAAQCRRAMKKLPRYLLAGVIALAFGTATIVAQEGDKKDKGPSKSDLAKYDANKDGSLDESETAAMKADKDSARKARLDKYDANKDGKINKDEKATEDADKAAAKEAKKAQREAEKAEKAKAKSKDN